MTILHKVYKDKDLVGGDFLENGNTTQNKDILPFAEAMESFVFYSS
jgi:hypothetical protein